MTRGAGAILVAGLLALAGCKGDAGAQGPQGQPGEPGTSIGTIAGTLQVTGGAPVPGASVTTTPLSLVGVTAANGTFSIANVPVGTYTLTVSGPGVTGTSWANVVVVANTTTDLGVKTLAYTPLAISFAAVPAPAGFGKAVPLTATVTGATGTLAYTWSVVSGPTAGAFSSKTVANPTFTTGTLQDVIAGGAVKFLAVPDRAGVLAFTSQQQVYATYTLKLSVSDGKYAQEKSVSVSPAGWVTGSKNVGVGSMVVGDDAPAATYAWTLAGPAGSTATLEAADTRNPWFVADVAGDYTLANGATSVVVKADTFVGATPSCGFCHGGLPQAQKDKIAGIWAEYQTSFHANYNAAAPSKAAKGIFAAGLDGEIGPYYSAACIKCHTTGYDPTAQSGGFDEKGFVWPATLQAGNFAALTAEQKQFGVIGCESCHGPIASHAAGGGAPPKAFFNAEACAYCHDALTHHDRYQLWSQSRHENLAIAEDEATVESRGATAAHCGRCHAAQGYARWSDQLNTTGNTGNITKPDGTAADVAYLTSLGLTKAEVHPQTCQACHDPHTTGLRIDGSKPTPLPAGFTVTGGGAGQLCMSCHNTRNGARGDAIVLSSFSAPHVAAQTDVFWGKNAYFVSGINTSRHVAVSETCVGCHMSKTGATPNLFLQPYTSNHSWTVGPQLCADCHGAAVSAEGLKANVEATLAQLNTLGSNVVKAKLSAAPFWATLVYVPTDSNSSALVAVDPAANPITAVTIVEVHGQTAAELTFTSPITFNVAAGAVTATTVQMQLGAAYTGSSNATPRVFDLTVPANATLVKSLWNYFLVHGDGSGGVHNPTFVNAVLSGAQTNLIAIQP